MDYSAHKCRFASYGWQCAALVAWLGVNPAAAQITSCNLPAGAQMNVVTYYNPTSSSTEDPLCTKTGSLRTCRLAGWLYQPAGSMPFPAIVINHASANPRAESDYCPIVEYFTGKGYIVFEPVRRGYSGDNGIKTNTGELPATTVERVLAGRPASRSPYDVTLVQICTTHDPRTGYGLDADCVRTELQANQKLETRAAVSFLQGLGTAAVRLVDSERIALLGHAVGANITAMSVVDSIPGVQAAVLLSPGERNWDREHPYLRWRLFQSVQARKVSLSIMQPRDGESVGPTEELAEAAALSVSVQDHEFMASLMPAVGADDPEDVQLHFAMRATHVDRWAPLAWRFIRTYGVK